VGVEGLAGCGATGATAAVVAGGRTVLVLSLRLCCSIPDFRAII